MSIGLRRPSPTARRHTLAGSVSSEHVNAAIFAAVAERGVTRRQVRDALRRLKRRRLRRAARVAAEHRTSVQPLATNAVVGQDATFCGRDDDGNKRWAEVQRDTASTKTVGLACGPAATGEDVMAQLEALRAARGELPLVFACDRGAQYENATVKDYLEANGVVLLPRLPRTPQHNAWSERGI
ncbi:MAG TPA: hypothetical protein VEI02_06880, partial [Planctomycetota bacterium]|nr:hypothetical protein [Planctomycetota bacterium]